MLWGLDIINLRLEENNELFEYERVWKTKNPKCAKLCRAVSIQQLLSLYFWEKRKFAFHTLNLFQCNRMLTRKSRFRGASARSETDTDTAKTSGVSTAIPSSRCKIKFMRTLTWSRARYKRDEPKSNGNGSQIRRFGYLNDYGFDWSDRLSIWIKICCNQGHPTMVFCEISVRRGLGCLGISILIPKIFDFFYLCHVMFT